TMLNKNKNLETGEDALGFLDKASINPTSRRDMKSAVKRVCDVFGCTPRTLLLKGAGLRKASPKACPAAHEMTPKTWANLHSRFRAALRLVGVIDPAWQGSAMQHTAWAPLVQAIAGDKRLSCGLIPFSIGAPAKPLLPKK